MQVLNTISELLIFIAFASAQIPLYHIMLLLRSYKYRLSESMWWLVLSESAI
jgi:predicted DNA-binding transcriptional regulator